MSKLNWVEKILAICTPLFIGTGLTLRKEIPQLGFSLIVIGVLCLIVLVILVFKGRKKYGVAELASEMENMSGDLVDFAGERERGSPIHRIKMNKQNWDDERKNEEWEEKTRELLEYESETIRIYRRRFASKVKYLVKEARKFGYEDEELTAQYEHPTNRLGIEMLSDRMGALALRMKKEVK